MAFKSDLGPFLAFLGANFDRGVKKVKFSKFQIFWTFLLIESLPVGHFSSPVWQIKGFFSAIQGVRSWKGSMPSNHGNLLPTETNFFFIPADFWVIFIKNHVFKFGFISLIRLSTTHFMIYFCFVLGPTLFWAIMTIFLQKFHFWGLNFTVFESEGPLLPKISQIGSIIVGKNCLPWKVDDFRFLKLPKMLSGLWDMPIFLEV